MEAELDSKIAQIISIVDDSISQETICQALLDNNLDVETTLNSLLNIPSKRHAHEPLDSDEPKRKRINAFELMSSKSELPAQKQTTKTLKGSDINNFLPCEFIPDILPPILASELLKDMMAETNSWHLLPTVIFQKGIYSSIDLIFYLERLSHHTTCFYVDKSSAASQRTHYYNGNASTTSFDFTALMKKSLDIITPIVNEIYSKRKRLRLELEGDWKADVCVANHYANESESVGSHTDKVM